MSRDYQRSRIYAWEDRYIHSQDHSVIPFEQAQSIVDYVWAEGGRTHPPKVVMISKTATRTAANANRLRIRISRRGIKTTVLLHEIAHSMTGSIDEPGNHGPAFVGTFMRLVCHHIRTFSLTQLMDTARSEGIDFNLTTASSGKPGGPGEMVASER
jgi:hypothetical protein